jgi:hypothetical protein
MAQAKRLLLTTQMRVTEVCFAVGFESLGTFTTGFGRVVGLSPQRLRHLCLRHGDNPLAQVAACGVPAPASTVHGLVTAPPGVDCFALVGLFPAGLPQGLPMSCTALWAPGSFKIGPVRPGIYTLFGLGYPGARSVLDAMLTEPTELLVRRWPRPIRIEQGQRQSGTVVLALQPPANIDPPVVLAAPVLAASAQQERSEHDEVVL